MLANEYRPQSFDQVVGQNPIVQTLLNDVQGKQRFQVFLFSGPSGVGKTTFARLTAAAYGTNSLDLLELDAASHSSVEDVRTLGETIYALPIGGSRRAIIIDEVHRLSKIAIDALLKLVEEPPDHLLWFFCTTSPHTLPDTLVSRCIWFSFQKISTDQTIHLLRQVCEEYNIDYADEALQIIAMEADGNLRRALTILDYFTTGIYLGAEQLQAILGGAKSGEVQILGDTIQQRDVAGALTTVASLRDNGVVCEILVKQLLQYWRAVMLKGWGIDPDYFYDVQGNRAVVRFMPQFVNIKNWIDLELAVSQMEKTDETILYHDSGF